jgi:SPP1 gp7 family putative phage head morphogenesis protein
MNEAEYGLTGDFIFKEAVEFLKKKTPLTAGEYKALSEECRAKAFTVSGYTSLEVLQKFLDELTDACEEGKTKKDFVESMNDFLERNGYEGLNPFNADVIFRTNMQTAYNAGHYKSMTDPTTRKLRPFWKYVTAGDGQVRESHAQMEGRIYRADDPIWDVWYPPNGFRCRCTVVSMTKGQVERSGVPVSKGLPYDVDYSTGEIIDKFPDKGFSNNPAKDTWKPDLSDVDDGLKKAFKHRKQPQKS